MKSHAALFALFCSAAICAEPVTIRPIKTEKEIRFQIVEARPAGGEVFTFKIDTETGKTWMLQLSSDSLKKDGIKLVWMEIPEIVLTDQLSAATLVIKSSVFSQEQKPNPFDQFDTKKK